MENTVVKVTVAQNFANVKAFLEQNGADQALIDFIVDRAEKSKRKSATGETKAQKESRELSAKIATQAYEYMSANDSALTITDLINALGLNESTSKVTRALRDDGRFVAEKIKGKSMYKIA